MFEKLIYWAEVILGFGGLIFIHELGHFLMAKRAGVKVLRFAIGFDFWGLRLFRKTIGETEYVIGAFPLGGYVKMLGQEDLPTEGEEAESFPEGHFLSKGIGARMAIISGGVIANFALAFLLCYAAFVAGYHRYPPVVGSVGYDSLQAGLHPGDEIVSIDGDHVESWTEMFMAYAMQEPGRDVTVVVDRRGERVTLQLPVLRDPRDPINVPDFERQLGLQISAIVEGSPAAEVGLRAGDTLLSVDGERLESWEHFSTLVSARPGEVIDLEVRRLDDRGRPGDVEVLTFALGDSDDPYAPSRTLGIGSGEPPVVDGVLERSPAAAAGLRSGDRIEAVDGRAVTLWREAWLAIDGAEPGRPLALTVSRDGRDLELTVVPRLAQVWAIGIWGLPGIGVMHRAPPPPYPAPEPAGGLAGCMTSPPEAVPGVTVGWIDPEGPAADAGIQLGDVVRAISFTDAQGESREVPAYDWNLIYSALSSEQVPDGHLRLEIDRGGQMLSKAVEMRPFDGGHKRGLVGVYGSWQQELARLGPVEALGPSLRKPFQLFDEFLKGFKAMFTGRVSPKTISGPVGILDITYAAASQGIGDLLLLLALISVNLAIINFLPIPITDGGHVVFLLYEKVRGRRMSEAVQGKLMWAGLVFILLVFVFATWNDLLRLFQR